MAASASGRLLVAGSSPHGGIRLLDLARAARDVAARVARRVAVYVALRDAHFPPPGCSVEALDAFRTPAQRRLVFEEFFFFQLGLALRRREAATRMKPRTIRVDDRIREIAFPSGTM